MGEEIGQALWYSGPRRVEFRTEKVTSPGPREMRVRSTWGALSRGTESLIFAGRVPPTEFQRMRSPHMGGNFPFPVKYGYSIVGVAETGPANLIGRIVFVLHPHQTLFNVPCISVAALPDGIPPRRAVLAANMETALNAVWDGAPGPADRIVIIGAGVIGALVAFLCRRIPGVEVTLVDVNTARAKIARTLDVAFAAPDEAPIDCDLVFHASATAGGLRNGNRMRRRRGHCRGAELVRRRDRRRAARRRVSQPTTASCFQSGRAGLRIAPRAMDGQAAPRRRDPAFAR